MSDDQHTAPPRVGEDDPSPSSLDAPSPVSLDVPSPASLEVLNALGAGVLVVDAQLSIHFRNETAASWLPDALDVESALEGTRFLGPFEGWAAEFSGVLESGKARRFECALPGSTGSGPRLVSVHCTRIRGPRPGESDSVAVLIVEQTQREASEERHEVARRLTSLGKLATRVAHELNNPLDGILRYVNLALRVADDTPEPRLKTYLAESRTGLMRMVQIIGDLLEFSRATGGEFDEAGIDQIIEESIRATAARAETNRVVVTADFQTSDLPSVRGSRLYQVCCNVLRNAIDAMPDGGRLSVSCGVVGDEVVIRVSDTGAGLPTPPEKVFEPFFTTKDPGKGTGLGLAICKDFIEDMDGTITAAPGENGGAVFTIRLPERSCRPSGESRELPPRATAGSRRAAAGQCTGRLSESDEIG